MFLSMSLNCNLNLLLTPLIIDYSAVFEILLRAIDIYLSYLLNYWVNLNNYFLYPFSTDYILFVFVSISLSILFSFSLIVFKLSRYSSLCFKKLFFIKSISFLHFNNSPSSLDNFTIDYSLFVLTSWPIFFILSSNLIEIGFTFF